MGETMHLVVGFRDITDRVHPWPAGPAVNDQDLLALLRAPNALVVPIEANPKDHPEEFVMFDTMEELKDQEERLLKQLEQVRGRISSLAPLGDGRWWLQTQRGAFARQVGSEARPEVLETQALVYRTVETSLSDPLCLEEMLQPGLHVLRRCTWSRAFATISGKIPRSFPMWDVVTDSPKVSRDLARYLPEVRSMLWDGSSMGWPTNLPSTQSGSEIVILLLTRHDSVLGYLGSLDTVNYLLVAELSSTPLRTVDQVCAYWAEQRQHTRSTRQRREEPIEEIPLEVIERALRNAQEFCASAIQETL